jgi:hypothetical protein
MRMRQTGVRGASAGVGWALAATRKTKGRKGCAAQSSGLALLAPRPRGVDWASVTAFPLGEKTVVYEMASTTNQRPASENVVEWADVLGKLPPGRDYAVSNFVKGGQHSAYRLLAPTIWLHCQSEPCERSSIFEHLDSDELPWLSEAQYFVLTYTCRHCQAKKVFACHGIGQSDGSGAVVKYGELPGFGPPVPSRVAALVGPDRDLFFAGYRAEGLGMGMGAFAYYRRVVENQKNRLVEEISRVAKVVGADPGMLELLEKVKAEQRFTKAIEEIKPSIPQSLLIKGHNPLMLLHDALSEGIHAETDQQCLEIAGSIRVILSELADKMTSALKDTRELNDAVSRLIKKKSGLPSTK